MNDHDLLPPEWGELWRSAEGPRSQDIVRAVQRRTRWHTLRTAADTLIAFAGGVVLAFVALRNAHPADRPFALLYGAVILFIAVYGIVNARGTWRPRGESPVDHARLEALRAERRIRATRAESWFLGLSVLLYAPWIWSRTVDGGPSHVAILLLYLAVFAAVYVFVLRRRVRRARADRDLWRKAAEELSDPE